MLPRSILRITQHHRRIMTTTPLVHLKLRGKIVAFMKRLPAQLIHSDESIRLIPLAVELWDASNLSARRRKKAEYRRAR
jgi:hypothetical protein